MSKKKKRGRSAWVVTRHSLDHAKKEVLAIFNDRLGGVRVREFVELLDITSRLSLAEQASRMWSGHNGGAYSATFGQTMEGDPWADEVKTWGDPYLLARRVDDLVVEQDTNGNEVVTWAERPRESSAWMHPEVNK